MSSQQFRERQVKEEEERNAVRKRQVNRTTSETLLTTGSNRDVLLFNSAPSVNLFSIDRTYYIHTYRL